MPLDKAAYLETFQRDAAAMSAAARMGLETPVAATPGWNVGGMIGHVVGIYLHWEKRMRTEGDESVFLEPPDLAAYPGLAEWFEANQAPEMLPPEIVTCLDDSAARLYAALEAADPTMPVGTWFPPDQTAGFVQRRMAQETVVHRWDAENAHGIAKPIEPELARDGIDEMLDVHLPMRRKWIEPRPSAGERFHFHATDDNGEWLVDFAPEGVRVSREHAKGDVAVRGTVSELLLWLWGRVPTDEMEILGDREIASRWFDLVPPD